MYILHVNSFNVSHGGAEKTTRRQMLIAQAAGWRTGLVYFLDAPGTAGSDEKWPVMRIDPDKSREKVRDQMKALLKKEAPDIVHYHNFYPCSYLLQDEELARISRPILSEHSATLTCPGINRYHPRLGRTCFLPVGLFCVMLPLLTRCVWFRNPIRLRKYVREFIKIPALWPNAKIIGQSEAVKRLLAMIGFAERQIFLLPNYAEIPEPSDPPAGRTLLFVGRIEEEKGLQDLLFAMRPLDCRLVICGSGGYEQEIRRCVIRCGLEQRVQFLGRAEGDLLEKAYRECAVVVLPSRCFESFSNVGLEAMAHGRPLIAYDCGGVNEYLRDGANGFLVASGNRRQLRRRIRTLLDKPALMRFMGENGRHLCQERFSYESYKKDLLQLYHSIMSSGPAGSTRREG